MIARNYYSNNKVLQFALEDIYIQFKNDIFLDKFDFIIFSIPPTFDINDINSDIKKIFKTNNYFAFNATNSFYNNKVLSNKINALFLKFNKKDFKTFYTNKIDEKIKSYIKNNNNYLHLIFVTYDIDLIEELVNIKFQKNINVIGGVIPQKLIDDVNIGYFYTNNEIVKKGIFILSLNLSFDSEILTGYIPIGPEYRINLAKQNRIYVIEFKDASLIATSLMKKLDTIQDLWKSPILIKKDNLIIPRTFKDIKENFYIEFFGKIENNEVFQMSFGNKEILINNDKKQIKQLKKRITTVDIIFNFSCVAREYILEDKENQELEIISSILNAPLFGFYTFGELHSIDNRIVLFNQSSLIVGVKSE